MAPGGGLMLSASLAVTRMALLSAPLLVCAHLNNFKLRALLKAGTAINTNQGVNACLLTV